MTEGWHSRPVLAPYSISIRLPLGSVMLVIGHSARVWDAPGARREQVARSSSPYFTTVPFLSVALRAHGPASETAVVLPGGITVSLQVPSASIRVQVSFSVR